MKQLLIRAIALSKFKLVKQLDSLPLMMAVTHAAIATAGTSLILGTANPLILGLSVIGSQLLDIDTTTSTVGKICYPISFWIEDKPSA